MPASFICLAVCVSLDFGAAVVSARDWMVMSLLWKATVSLLCTSEKQQCHIEEAGAQTPINKIPHLILSFLHIPFQLTELLLKFIS